MGTVKDKDYKKPKLKKDDVVLIVDMSDGSDSFKTDLTSVSSVSNKKVKVEGNDTEFSEDGTTASKTKRIIFIPAAMKEAWSRSSFFKNPNSIGKIIMNRGAINSIDAQNDKLS